MSKKVKAKSKSKKKQKTNTINSISGLKTFWDSAEAKQIRRELDTARNNSIQKSIEWYNNLSQEEKYYTVQGLLYTIISSEKEGSSHKILQSKLGIYPEGFWIDELDELHSILYNHYFSNKCSKQLLQDVEEMKKNN